MQMGVGNWRSASVAWRARASAKLVRRRSDQSPQVLGHAIKPWIVPSRRAACDLGRRDAGAQGGLGWTTGEE